MSFLSEVGYRIKKGLQFIYGSAELDPVRDPTQNLEREHEGRPNPAPDRAKHWDRG